MTVTAKASSPPTRRELRQFGCGLGILLGLFGSLHIWQGLAMGGWLLLAGAAVASAFWRQWPGTRGLYIGWMRAAAVWGRLLTTLLLALLYLVVLTPTALLARGMGKRFLSVAPEPGRTSYWTARDRQANEPVACERQS